MVLSCVVFHSKVLFTMFTNPCLAKHVYKGVGFQKDLWTSQGVFLDRDISAGRRAISFHINTARQVPSQARQGWVSGVGTLSFTEQWQHLHESGTFSLDSACSLLPLSPKPEGSFRSRLATSTTHSPQP